VSLPGIVKVSGATFAAILLLFLVVAETKILWELLAGYSAMLFSEVGWVFLAYGLIGFLGILITIGSLVLPGWLYARRFSETLGDCGRRYRELAEYAKRRRQKGSS